MEIKKQYIAPKLTVVTFKTEKGFANSIIDNLMFWELDGESNEQVESYQQHDVWYDGEGFWN